MARPIWEPQLRTPGMVSSSLQPRIEMRTFSGCELPGMVTQCIRKSRSLNDGSNDWPSSGHKAKPATATTPVVT